MQTTNNTTKQQPEPQSKHQAQKQLVEELKVDWKLMWAERFNDKIRAEGVSTNDFERLFVDQGTIIHATKDFKALNFKQILEQHMVENPDRYVQPDASVGGWKKFIKNEITTVKTKPTKRADAYVAEKPKGQQPKKSGRGWLHK
jgi:hypothetical protein